MQQGINKRPVVDILSDHTKRRVVMNGDKYVYLDSKIEVERSIFDLAMQEEAAVQIEDKKAAFRKSFEEVKNDFLNKGKTHYRGVDIYDENQRQTDEYRYELAKNNSDAELELIVNLSGEALKKTKNEIMVEYGMFKANMSRLSIRLDEFRKKLFKIDVEKASKILDFVKKNFTLNTTDYEVFGLLGGNAVNEFKVGLGVRGSNVSYCKVQLLTEDLEWISHDDYKIGSIGSNKTYWRDDEWLVVNTSSYKKLGDGRFENLEANWLSIKSDKKIIGFKFEEIGSTISLKGIRLAKDTITDVSLKDDTHTFAYLEYAEKSLEENKIYLI